MKTFGEFYREKVLAIPRRQRRRLPVVKDGTEIRVEKALFGWQVVYGHKILPCRSEAEARYLKLGMKLGMKEMEVPAEDDYLRLVVAEFENLKSGVDEIMNKYLAGVGSKRVSGLVRHRVYSRLLREKGNRVPKRKQNGRS